MSPSTTRSGLTIQRKKKKHRITTQDHPAVYPIEERDQRGELDQVDPARADPAREDLHHQVDHRDNDDVDVDCVRSAVVIMIVLWTEQVILFFH